MRDGVKLAADAWFPKDEKMLPVILLRTPYLKKSPLASMMRWGNILQITDMYLSYRMSGEGVSLKGNSNSFHQEAADGFDSVECIARQSWSNGKVGMMGASYSGSVQWLAAKERPPHLSCLVSTAAWEDPFEEAPYHQGMFNVLYSITSAIMMSEEFSAKIDMSKINWMEVLKHRPLITLDEKLGFKMPAYRKNLLHNTIDEYWRQIIFTDKDFKKIDIPALHLTGWFDVDQIGEMIFWNGMRKFSPASDKQYLIVGPWEHGHLIYGGKEKVGQMEVPKDKNYTFTDFLRLHVSFFNHFMKTGEFELGIPRARIYIPGLDQWKDLKDYPLKSVKMKELYLHSGGKANTGSGDGKLSWISPDSESPDQYVFNPRDPIVHMEGYGIHAIDNRKIEERKDVLVYTSTPLREPLTIVGKVMVKLFASTSARDTDFVVKLLDVYPDGKVLNLGPFGKGFIRARYRNGYEKEELIQPGKVELYQIKLFDIGHTFLPGHQLRVEICSSAAPFQAPNQNTGNPVAYDELWKTAQQTIYHSKKYQSAIILPIAKIRMEEK